MSGEIQESVLRRFGLVVLLLLGLALQGFSIPALAMESVAPAADELSVAPGYLARIELNTPAELLKALKRAERLFLEGRLQAMLPPATLVVHGPEVAVFFRQAYGENRELVDLAAKLSAFRVVDIRVCETRMGVLGRDRSELFPFISTVPFGPDEVNRLIDELEYVYF